MSHRNSAGIGKRSIKRPCPEHGLVAYWYIGENDEYRCGLLAGDSQDPHRDDVCGRVCPET